MIEDNDCPLYLGFNMNESGLLKEDEDEEDHGTKEMQMKDLTDILSHIDMAAGKLCDIDPDWECSSTVKWGIRDILHPYYEILQEKKKK
jgi:hypothetical protein